ncbi:hypothetical protein OF83DRAFT_594280 [Amylostereum chailletii]|nr:hypothetical protein OF83DRAFT_594280 [Amylostereum chailletii]
MTFSDGDVGFLKEMMGPDADPELVRRLLEKHNGDVQKAANELLNEPDTTQMETDTFPANFGAPQKSTTTEPKTPPPSKPVIDLTGENEDADMTRALKASLEGAGIGQNDPTFGPSDRAPDENWALTVPSNVLVEQPPAGISQEDQSLNQAIQESLNSTYTQFANEELESKPVEEMVRIDNRPVALRPTQATFVYAAFVLQALYAVPQVRRRLAPWRADADSLDALEEEESIAHTVQEFFVNMDLAALSELNIDRLLEIVGLQGSSRGPDAPGDLSSRFYSKLTFALEGVLFKDEATRSSKWSRLFHFRHGPADTPADAQIEDRPFDHRVDQPIVQVDIRDDEPGGDLLSSLSRQLTAKDAAHCSVIFEPSEVVAFKLLRQELPPSYSGAPSPPRRAFRYPKHLYLDQFMKAKFELANEKRTMQRKYAEDIRLLNERKAVILHSQGKDNLKDMRSAVHYFENVANKADAARKQQVEATAMALRKILVRMENQVETIDSEIAKLKTQSAVVFDDPELKQHRYDLRAVLMHDGLYGRSHVYSYVQSEQRWWCTVDHAVNEVSEDVVLTDKAGLHLGAGPYMLIYSRALPEGEEEGPLPWPSESKDSVKHNNKLFIQQLPPTVVADVRQTSPPTSPGPSDYGTPTSNLDDAVPVEEEMDLSP